MCIAELIENQYDMPLFVVQIINPPVQFTGLFRLPALKCSVAFEIIGQYASSRITPRKNIKQTAAKKHGACPRGGRVVRVHAVLQQLEGCVG